MIVIVIVIDIVVNLNLLLVPPFLELVVWRSRHEALMAEKREI